MSKMKMRRHRHSMGLCSLRVMGSDPPILKGMIAVIGPLKKTTVICEDSVRFDQPK